jgi:hypothetical protein
MAGFQFDDRIFFDAPSSEAAMRQIEKSLTRRIKALAYTLTEIEVFDEQR